MQIMIKFRDSLMQTRGKIYMEKFKFQKFKICAAQNPAESRESYIMIYQKSKLQKNIFIFYWTIKIHFIDHNSQTRSFKNVINIWSGCKNFKR